MADLSRKRERERLKIQRDPHYMRLAEGCYLGFRRGPDTWTARFRDRDGEQHYKALNVVSGEYDDAKAAAEDWFGQMGKPVRSVKRATVQKALDAYLVHLRSQGRHSAAKAATGLFKTTVTKDGVLGTLALEDATRNDFKEWRGRLCKGRAPQSVNRYVRQVTAALTLAVDELEYVGDKDAWNLASLEEDDTDETAVFLTPAQRTTLIKAATERAGAFFRGLELTGARPGELAVVTVRDFDATNGTVRFATRKGKGSKLRVRYTVLDEAGQSFFEKQTKNKLPAAHLFTEDGSQFWRRHIWARETREAIERHNSNAETKEADKLPAGIGVYSFRHSRISELLQVHGIDPLTVAQQTGTSLAMIEKNYLRFIPHAFKDKLAKLKAAT